MVNTENIIKLPNKLRDPYIFEEILEITGEYHYSKIDMSQIVFIEPYSMLSVLLLGKNYLIKTGNKIKLVNIPINIHQYLERMDFISKEIFDLDIPLNPKLKLKRSLKSAKLLEIYEIPNKERESIKSINLVISEFRKKASYILKYWISDSIVDYFITVISELCQNIFEHSMNSGYISMQTYSVGNKNTFCLAICDSGIGIKESLKNKIEEKENNSADYIKSALFTPISSKRDFGFGLCQVNSIIERLNGSIFIRSYDAFVAALYNTKKDISGQKIFQKTDLSKFQGTQIAITL